MGHAVPMAGSAAAADYHRQTGEGTKTAAAAADVAAPFVARRPKGSFTTRADMSSGAGDDCAPPAAVRVADVLPPSPPPSEELPMAGMMSFSAADNLHAADNDAETPHATEAHELAAQMRRNTAMLTLSESVASSSAVLSSIDVDHMTRSTARILGELFDYNSGRVTPKGTIQTLHLCAMLLGRGRPSPSADAGTHRDSSRMQGSNGGKGEASEAFDCSESEESAIAIAFNRSLLSEQLHRPLLTSFAAIGRALYPSSSSSERFYGDESALVLLKSTVTVIEAAMATRRQNKKDSSMPMSMAAGSSPADSSSAPAAAQTVDKIIYEGRKVVQKLLKFIFVDSEAAKYNQWNRSGRLHELVELAARKRNDADGHPPASQSPSSPSFSSRQHNSGGGTFHELYVEGAIPLPAPLSMRGLQLVIEALVTCDALFPSGEFARELSGRLEGRGSSSGGGGAAVTNNNRKSTEEISPTTTTTTTTTTASRLLLRFATDAINASIDAEGAGTAAAAAQTAAFVVCLADATLLAASSSSSSSSSLPTPSSSPSLLAQMPPKMIELMQSSIVARRQGNTSVSGRSGGSNRAYQSVPPSFAFANDEEKSMVEKAIILLSRVRPQNSPNRQQQQQQEHQGAKGKGHAANAGGSSSSSLSAAASEQLSAAPSAHSSVMSASSSTTCILPQLAPSVTVALLGQSLAVNRAAATEWVAAQMEHRRAEAARNCQQMAAAVQQQQPEEEADSDAAPLLTTAGDGATTAEKRENRKERRRQQLAAAANKSNNKSNNSGSVSSAGGVRRRASLITVGAADHLAILAGAIGRVASSSSSSSAGGARGGKGADSSSSSSHATATAATTVPQLVAACEEVLGMFESEWASLATLAVNAAKSADEATISYVKEALAASAANSGAAGAGDTDARSNNSAATTTAFAPPPLRNFTLNVSVYPPSFVATSAPNASESVITCHLTAIGRFLIAQRMGEVLMGDVVKAGGSSNDDGAASLPSSSSSSSPYSDPRAQIAHTMTVLHSIFGITPEQLMYSSSSSSSSVASVSSTSSGSSQTTATALSYPLGMNPLAVVASTPPCPSRALGMVGGTVAETELIGTAIAYIVLASASSSSSFSSSTQRGIPLRFLAPLRDGAAIRRYFTGSAPDTTVAAVAPTAAGGCDGSATSTSATQLSYFHRLPQLAHLLQALVAAGDDHPATLEAIVALLEEASTSLLPLDLSSSSLSGSSAPSHAAIIGVGLVESCLRPAVKRLATALPLLDGWYRARVAATVARLLSRDPLLSSPTTTEAASSGIASSSSSQKAAAATAPATAASAAAVPISPPVSTEGWLTVAFAIASVVQATSPAKWRRTAGDQPVAAPSNGDSSALSSASAPELVLSVTVRSPSSSSALSAVGLLTTLERLVTSPSSRCFVDSVALGGIVDSAGVNAILKQHGGGSSSDSNNGGGGVPDSSSSNLSQLLLVSHVLSQPSVAAVTNYDVGDAAATASVTVFSPQPSTVKGAVAIHKQCMRHFERVSAAMSSTSTSSSSSPSSPTTQSSSSSPPPRVHHQQHHTMAIEGRLHLAAVALRHGAHSNTIDGVLTDAKKALSSVGGGSGSSADGLFSSLPSSWLLRGSSSGGGFVGGGAAASIAPLVALAVEGSLCSGRRHQSLSDLVAATVECGGSRLSALPAHQLASLLIFIHSPQEMVALGFETVNTLAILLWAALELKMSRLSPETFVQIIPSTVPQQYARHVLRASVAMVPFLPQPTALSAVAELAAQHSCFGEIRPLWPAVHKAASAMVDAAGGVEVLQRWSDERDAAVAARLGNSSRDVGSGLDSEREALLSVFRRLEEASGACDISFA